MGNVFSKKASLREILSTLDEKITETEVYLETLKRRQSAILTNVYVCSLPIASSIFAYAYLLDKGCILYLVMSVIPVLMIRFVIKLFFQRRINYNVRLLKTLKETQKKSIEELKKEPIYVETKKLVEKYEGRASGQREKGQGGTLAKDISTKTRGLVDKMADLILGDDPSTMYALICEKCFSHNGLSHPLEYNLTKFCCFNCKHLNDKTRPTRHNENTQIGEDENKE
jgi:hypothetical protein